MSEPTTNPPDAMAALPWAHVMASGDLHLFLDDLAAAAMTRWQTEPDGQDVPDRVTLALVEKACAKWRTPGQGHRSDEPERDPVDELLGANLSLYEAEQENLRLRAALKSARRGRRRLREQLAAVTKAAVEGRAALAALCFDHEDPGTAALGALYLLQQATPSAPMEAGEAVPKVYRASHDSISMGLYLTAAAARAHCEAEERRSWAASCDPSFDWIEDDEDGVAEMTVWVGGEETATGYVVTPLEVATAYDLDADE